MGLDMYLSARLYVSDYSGGGKAVLTPLTNAVKKVLKKLPYSDESCMKSVSIALPVMYWRKANAIHNWFVTNVQEGKDECQETYVSVEQLRELEQLVTVLLDARDPALVLEKMPPTTGFLFGSTDIDEYFWGDLSSTKAALNALLMQVEHGVLTGWDFYYHSSW